MTVLGQLLRNPRIRAATLVDVDSGMVLDARTGDGSTGDLELLGARYAELVRHVLALLAGPACEIVVGAGDDLHHVARLVPDPHGDRLAVAVVVVGTRRSADRTLKRLRKVSADALTAGPSTIRRSVLGGPSLPLPERRDLAPPPALGPNVHGGAPLPITPAQGPVPIGREAPGDQAMSLLEQAPRPAAAVLGAAPSDGLPPVPARAAGDAPSAPGPTSRPTSRPTPPSTLPLMAPPTLPLMAPPTLAAYAARETVRPVPTPPGPPRPPAPPSELPPAPPG